MARRILVIDDTLTLIAYMQACLTEVGYYIFGAPQSHSDIRQIVSEKPDLLILGLALPQALDLLQQVRKEPSFTQLPVIVLLESWASDAEIFRGWELRVDAFLPASLNCFDLRAYLKRIFQSLDEDRSPDTT